MRDVDPTLPRDGSDSIATNERDCTAITEPRAIRNLVSTILGIILIGELGLIVVLPFRNAFGAGAWVATIIVGIGVNGCVESMVVRQWFKPDFGLKDFWLLLAANALTVGIAYGSLGLFPIHQ
jgi:hypothetical protein